MNRVILLITFFFGVVILSACTPAPEVADMIPSTPPSAISQSDKVLRVGEVTGGKETKPMMQSTIDDAGFRQALVETLQKSGLFRSVITDQGAADYELQTEIISQEVQGVYDKTATLFVHYRLLSVSTQQEIWKENLLSRYVAEFEESVFVLDRSKEANEGAVRENLLQLVEKLSQVLSE